MMLNFELEQYRGRFITVTEVRVSKDIHYADAWVSIMGEKQVRLDTLAELTQDAGPLRKNLAHRVYLRHIPELRFFLDETLDESDKIEGLLKSSGVVFGAKS